MAVTKSASAWTYDDLLTLPDDGKRYEIIQGELYEMPAPSSVHAVTVANLLALLRPLIEALRGWLLAAPLDVFLPGGDVVQPDIVVLVPDGTARLIGRGVDGPPDLAIEVLSPSNRDHDAQTKRNLYSRAGVREYWLVDPEARTVDLLTLDRGALRRVQTATGHDLIDSTLLGVAIFPLAEMFARLDEIAE